MINIDFRFPCFEEFLTGMVKRLIMGRQRYGGIEKLDWDFHLEEYYAKKLETRWREFRATLNLECLIDIANFALILYVIGKHLNRTCKPIQRRWR